MHIRNFMTGPVDQYLNKIRPSYPDTTFLTLEPNGTSFNPKNIPAEIISEIDPFAFSQIIKKINYTIQKYSYKEKFSPLQKLAQEPFTLISFLVLLGVVSLIFVNNWIITIEMTSIICGLLISFLLIIIVLYAIESFKTKPEIGNVIDVICEEINTYLNFLSSCKSHKLDWRLGKDFYWIEIRKKKSLCRKVIFTQ